MNILTFGKRIRREHVVAVSVDGALIAVGGVLIYGTGHGPAPLACLTAAFALGLVGGAGMLVAVCRSLLATAGAIGAGLLSIGEVGLWAGRHTRRFFVAQVRS